MARAGSSGWIGGRIGGDGVRQSSRGPAYHRRRPWPTSSRSRSSDGGPPARPAATCGRCCRARCPSRSTRTSTCSSRGGAASGRSSSSARPTRPASGDVRIVDARRRGPDRGTPRAGRHGRPGRRALGDPRRRARRRRCATGGRTRRRSRRGSPASRAGRSAFLAFDLLHLDGRSLLGQPLVKRREALRRVLRPGDEVVAVPAIATEGRALFEAIVGPGPRRHDGPPAPGPLPAGRCAAGCGGSSRRRPGGAGGRARGRARRARRADGLGDGAGPRDAQPAAARRRA